MLTGSNTEECVWAPTFTRKTNASYPTGGYTFHMTKRGTGTWHLNVGSAFSGTFAGMIHDYLGWNAVFASWTVFSVIGVALFVLAARKKWKI